MYRARLQYIYDHTSLREFICTYRIVNGKEVMYQSLEDSLFEDCALDPLGYDSGPLSLIDGDENDYDYEVDTSQSTTVSKQKRGPKGWPSAVTLCFIQGCIDYCQSSNKTKLDADDETVDWDTLIATVKWPTQPKTKEMCIKKIKDMQRQFVRFILSKNLM